MASLTNSPMKKISDAQLSRDLEATIARLSELWSRPDLREAVATRFSARLSKSWARTNLDTRTITFADSLRNDPSLLDEVLCHELAHIVAHDAIGRHEGPHGATWQRLVRSGGFAPRLRLTCDDAPRLVDRSSSRFLHRCPVCDFSRVAARPMRSWRCADCAAAGLSGSLAITQEWGTA